MVAMNLAKYSQSKLIIKINIYYLETTIFIITIIIIIIGITPNAI